MVRPCGAREAMDSPSGTGVRPAMRVMMTLWLTPGRVYSTPAAALVYKATWPEEKVVRCTVGTLAQAGQDHHISKTALVLVGDFLSDQYQRSLLYHPGFSTEYRIGDGSAEPGGSL